MDRTKIQISEEELRIMQDPGIILTKNAVIEKVYQLFALLANGFQELSSQSIHLPLESIRVAPKISRGENYKGLPYVMMDYPRNFSASNIFAVRTLFWWGHFFSISLHLRGSYREQFRETIINSLRKGEMGSWFFQTGSDEWQHHPDGETHLEISKIPTTKWESLFEENEFLKLSQFIPLKQWENAEGILLNYFDQLIQLLKN